MIDTGDVIDFSNYLSKNDVMTLIASHALTEDEK
ncbi:MAG: hypothetical protein HND53_10425 [Proteobacteria bacterium]|nr:hypothetical protein [Pseudomonadota bacterium]NOG60906.1 hypothetical protein [Pseudomonadota bacterium]